jgi:hypothetical protein
MRFWAATWALNLSPMIALWLASEARSVIERYHWEDRPWENSIVANCPKVTDSLWITGQAGMETPDYDDPEFERLWCDQQRRQVTEYLRVQGVDEVLYR